MLVVLATAAFVYASNAQQTATQQRNTALALRAAAAAEGLINRDPRHATKLALAAYLLHPSTETEGPLIGASAALAGIDVKTPYVRISGNGRVLVCLYTAAENATIFSITEDGLQQESSVPVLDGAREGFRPSVSPNGKILLASNRNREFAVWDISNIREPVKRATIPAMANIADWSPDSRYVMTTTISSESESVTENSNLWDLGNLTKPVFAASIPGHRPTFVSGRDLLATIKGEAAVLLKLRPDGRSYEPSATISTPGRTPGNVEFSIDGRQAMLDEFRTARDSDVGGETRSMLLWRSVSVWRTDPGRPAELLQRKTFLAGEIPSLQASHDGAFPPTILTRTFSSITIWDSRDLDADRKIISPTTGGAMDILSAHFAPELNALFMVTYQNDKHDFRRLELSADKSASNACRRGAETTNVDIWVDNFPGVKPFRLCP